MTTIYAKAHTELHHKHARPLSRDFTRFFKTGPGQYAEHDRFLNVDTPSLRALSTKYAHLPLHGCVKLMHSKYNEERMLGLMILTAHYNNQESETKKKFIVDVYLSNKQYVNNWNLVDGSAPYILGDYLIKGDRSILNELSSSGNLWDRRIAVVATLTLIKNNEFKPTLSLVTKYLNDPEDLMHKACGWMLREVGKRNQKVLEAYLVKNIKKLPRTTLRYAIERFPEELRKHYLQLK